MKALFRRTSPFPVGRATRRSCAEAFPQIDSRSQPVAAVRRLLSASKARTSEPGGLMPCWIMLDRPLSQSVRRSTNSTMSLIGHGGALPAL